MWNPFRSKKSRRDLATDYKQIINAYGAVLSDGTEAMIRDVSCLPAAKDQIKAALTVGILTASSNEEREVCRVGYLYLASFQPGVGADGIMTGELTADDIIAGAPWVEKMQSETKELKQELAIIDRKLTEIRHK